MPQNCLTKGKCECDSTACISVEHSDSFLRALVHDHNWAHRIRSVHSKSESIIEYYSSNEFACVNGDLAVFSRCQSLCVVYLLCCGWFTRHKWVATSQGGLACIYKINICPCSPSWAARPVNVHPPILETSVWTCAIWVTH
jgi:hypothetical protein